MTFDLTHLAEFPGKWVALAEDETTVLAIADTASEARDAALAQCKAPVLYQVPDTRESGSGHEVRV